MRNRIVLFVFVGMILGACATPHTLVRVTEVIGFQRGEMVDHEFGLEDTVHVQGEFESGFIGVFTEIRRRFRV